MAKKPRKPAAPKEPTQQYIQAENAELLDRAMNKVLKEGQTVITGYQEDGSAIIEKVTPSAAMFNAIRGRVKDLGISALPVKGTPSGDLIEQARERGLRINGRPIPSPLPPISEDDDAATG